MRRTGSLTATVWLLCFRRSWSLTLRATTGDLPMRFASMMRT
ncbi:hypothetical protein sh5_0046 [Citrobacter phage SH5]|uniref:Uncharacterized protein n=2 Tax=Kayfunavirus SH4 TaxID=2733632 RepID=A0A172JGJ3_9CAUD|nr:hypothetical protein BI008_gp48 [Citrobacter phage SH4]AMR59572.1 hypothetical protein sh4_0046 [Citrobacter phage SH4]AMR59622.1 hypothetical protein sh5_0046 [Citrobacter phage SH5]